MSFETSATSAHSDSRPERRAYERVPVAVFGRCMCENKLEIPCQIINISPGDLAAVSAHVPEFGEHIIIYMDNIGRVEGEVTRVFEGGFAIAIEATQRRREKLAGQIAWLIENVSFGDKDQRRHERMVPRQSSSEILLDDGRRYSIEIMDISLSGAAISCEVRPALGTKLTLAGMPGTVIRHFDDGIAIEFATHQNRSALDNRFI